MPSDHDERRDAAIDRFWDQVSLNQLSDTGDLDPADEATIRSLHENDNRPRPHPVFRRRLREELMSTTSPSIASRASLHSLSNGHTPVDNTWRLSTPRRAVGSQRGAPFVVAALVVLTLLAGFVGLETTRRQNQQPSLNLPALAGTPEITAADLAETDVPMYRVNPERTGAMPGPGPNGKPGVLWRVDVQGDLSTAPAIVDGVIYSAGTDGVRAFDASGAEVWHSLSGLTVSASPAVDAGIVFVGSEDGVVYALSAADGRVRWSFAEGRPLVSPAVVDGIVYTGGDDETLHAINAQSGEVVWSAPLGEAASRSPSVADGIVYIGSADGVLHAIEVASGAELWTFASGGDGLSTAAVADGVVYVGMLETDQTWTFALDAKSGDVLWRFTVNNGRALLPPAVGENLLFIPSNDGNLYAVNRADGSEAWRFTTGDYISAAPALWRDTIYLAGQDSQLYALDAATGDVRWQLPIEGPVTWGPVVTGGVIYVATDTGQFYALGDAGASLVVATPATPVVAAESTMAEYLWESRGNPASPLVHPTDIEMAPDGTLWVTDGGAGRFQIFDQDGQYLETWGAAGSAEGEFDFTAVLGDYFGGIEFAHDGGFYVLDTGNRRIQQFAADRSFVRAWGGEGHGEGQFDDAQGLALSPTGEVLVLDSRRQDIQVFSPDGKYLRKIDGMAAENPNPLDGNDLIADRQGNLYVAAATARPPQIDVLAADGTWVETIGRGDFSKNPQAMDLDEAGRLYVTTEFRVMVFNADGHYFGAWSSEGTGPGQMTTPGGIVVHGGHAYFSDYNGNRIEKFQLLPPLVL